MRPVTLATERLVLDQPTLDDAELITRYCRDPIFESFMVTPWPYRREHAVGFIEQYVPTGWATDAAYTWALRLAGQPNAELIGVVGYRTAGSDIGFWLGAPHRNRGYVTEAVGAVGDWLFARGVPRILWYCVVGNLASAAVARKSGFVFVGEVPSPAVHRGHGDAPAWHAILTPGSRGPSRGWPSELEQNEGDPVP